MGVVCRGFATSTRLVARAEGLAQIRLVECPPPNIAVQNPTELHECAGKIVDQVITALTHCAEGAVASDLAAKHGAQSARSASGEPGHIVFSGDLDAVNDYFRTHIWCDGLPIIPPTIEKVAAMLRFTDRRGDEVIGILAPRRLAATVWKIAVNGVMAGCRPEYLPVLIALIEAITDERFGVQQAGSTVGWTPLIILNGPSAKQLAFNSGQGVLRPEAQANITVSRFLRLALMNIAGYRLGETDMATFGRNYYPVIAEAEEASPWQPFSMDLGFARGENVVTVQSADSTSHSFLSEGHGEDHLRVIAHELGRELGGQMFVPMEHFGGEVTPVIGLTPLVAGIIARDGYTKDDVRRYVFEHATVSARDADVNLNRHQLGLTLKESVRLGRLPAAFAKNDDPDRRVPVVHHAGEINIVVTGSPDRNRSFIAAQFGHQGLRVSKAIKLPANWAQLLNGNAR
ncbi:MAG: hypothetical protein ACKVQK_15190 [Burkholderiales bacterium]